MKTMVKYLGVAVLVLCTVASASDQRIAALGGDAGFWPDDDQNIYIFPATINNFNIAQFSGVGLDTSGNSSDNHSAFVLWGNDTKYGFSWDETGTNDMVTLLWGNGSMGLIVGLSSSASDPGSEGSVATSSMGFNVAWGSNMGFGEVGVGFNNASYDDGDSETKNDPSSMGFWVNLRRPQSLWIFDNMLVGFGYSSNNSDDGMAGNKDAETAMGLGVSLFSSLDIAEGTTGLIALGFGYSTVSNVGYNSDNSWTGIYLPAFTFAVESAMTDWATARVGLNQSYALSSSTTTLDVTSTNRGGAGTSFAFGLGFNYGSFNLDIDVTEGLFANPVNYITGNNLISPLGSTATMTYTW